MVISTKSFDLNLGGSDSAPDEIDVDEDFNQVENLSNQFQNEVIFNTRESNLVSTALFENKLRVFSYNQRRTENLSSLLDDEVYLNLINKDDQDSRAKLQNYLIFVDKLSLLTEISENSVSFRESINNVSKAAEINSKNFELLNYGNIVFDFLNSGSSNVIGKIFKRANDGFKSIVLNNIKNYEDIKLVEDQDSVYTIENTEIFSNTNFQKKFMQLNTRPALISNDNETNKFIYNTDKLVSQIHINYMQSEKFLSPNTFNSSSPDDTNPVLYIEDYPILEIGSRLTNNINFNEYYTSKGNVKNNLIRKNIRNNTLTIIDTSEVNSINSVDTCKFFSYSNDLYKTYYQDLYYQESSQNLISYDFNFGENNFDFLPETNFGLSLNTYNNRLFDESLSNTIFITDCRIKYGSTYNFVNEGLSRDITTITDINRIPISYFTTLGNYFKNSGSQNENDLSFNLSYLSFHNPTSDLEILENNILYNSTRKIPFTYRRKEEFESGRNDDIIFQPFENLVNKIKSLFESSTTEYSNNFQIDDVLNITRTKRTHDIYRRENVFNKYTNITVSAISNLSYLENILVLFEKVDKVIDTYSIGQSSAIRGSFFSAETSDSIESYNKKNSKVISIKAKIEKISETIGKAIKRVNPLFSRLQALNYSAIKNEDLNKIGDELNKIELYFEKINILLKRMFERFVKLEIDESTNTYSIEDGDFKLKYLVEHFDILPGDIYRYYFLNPRAFVASPEDFTNFLREKINVSLSTYTDKNRITTGDIYEEGRLYLYNNFGYENIISPGALSCQEQFLWSSNLDRANYRNYPRFYDYIYNSLYSILHGSRSETVNTSESIAGQFRDISTNEAINKLTFFLFRDIRSLNQLLNTIESENYAGYSYNITRPVNSILDVHAFKYDSSINKRVNSYLRQNYIEPCQNTLDGSTKIDFIGCLNKIKKTKLSKEGISIDEIMPFALKIRERAINLQKENKEIVFAYGNKESENVLLTLNDEEIKTLIQKETFTNNYRKDLLIDDSKIKTTNNLVVNEIDLEGNFEEIKNSILKISSFYYGNNTFKNNKTLLFRILQKINSYVNSHYENWNRSINQPEYIYNFDRNQAYYDYNNKDFFCNFQYDSFISKLFSSNISYDESKDFIKRFVAYSICKQTPFEDKVTSLSEIDILDDANSKVVFNENISEILKISKINNNSKEINNFIYSNKTLESVLKYTILEFKNPRETYVENEDSFVGYFGWRHRNPKSVFYNTLYPLNIWTYKNFSQNKITFCSSGYDYDSNSLSFFENFLEEQEFIYKENIQSEDEYNIIDSNRLNIPKQRDVNITKNISIKKIFEQEDSELLSQVRANSIPEEDKASDLVYKFRTSVKDKFWLSKSYDNALNEDSLLYYETKEKSPEEEVINKSNINDYNHDIPGLDMFYYSVNNGEKSMFYLFNDILTELLEYYKVDFEQFEDYDAILSFVNGENEISNSVFDLFKIYCNIFKIVFDRYQSYFIYNLCFSLTKENYTNYSEINYYLTNNLVKLRNIQINNVIQTFKMLPRITKDLSRIYEYFVTDENNGFNDLESNFNSISKTMDGLNVSLQDIDFESKDTDILLDLINTCNINDIVKSLNLDILYGYYKTLSNTNSLSQEITRETSLRLDSIRKYFLNENYMFETCLNNQFYLNMVSKKIQNPISRNIKLNSNFINQDKDLDDVTYFDTLFKGLKEEKLNDINILKHLYKKINETRYIKSDSTDVIETNFLVNQTFDFIKIGFQYDAISNFSENSLFKIDVYIFDHNTFDIEYLEDANFRKEKVKTFYYTPSLTSIPSSFFEELVSNNSKYVGYYNSTESIKNRFLLLNNQEVITNIRKIINTSGTSEFVRLDTDEYRFIENEDEDNYTAKLGSKIFSDQYVSMFCEYYEKLINNISSKNFFDSSDSLAERVVLEEFYDEMLSMNASDFINVFEISKDDFILGSKGDNFRLLTPKIEEVRSKNKASTFMEKLSKVKTDVDVYNILHVNKYYDFFNIMIKAPENKNVTYALKVEVL